MNERGQDRPPAANILFVYRQSEPALWTVGHYTPEGRWIAESDHDSPAEAADRAIRLNGGEPTLDEFIRSRGRPLKRRDANIQLDDAVRFLEGLPDTTRQRIERSPQIREVPLFLLEPDPVTKAPPRRFLDWIQGVEYELVSWGAESAFYARTSRPNGGDSGSPSGEAERSGSGRPSGTSSRSIVAPGASEADFDVRSCYSGRRSPDSRSPCGCRAGRSPGRRSRSLELGSRRRESSRPCSPGRRSPAASCARAAGVARRSRRPIGFCREGEPAPQPRPRPRPRGVLTPLAPIREGATLEEHLSTFEAWAAENDPIFKILEALEEAERLLKAAPKEVSR